MDNETRQYGAQGSEPPRPEHPKQYFPDQSQNQYQQPAYEPQYQQQYEYEPPYQEPYYEPEQKGSSAGAIALGVMVGAALARPVRVVARRLGLVHLLRRMPRRRAARGVSGG